ncbi:Uncharacterized conserved protein [Loktanella atrilutea]|uniref:Uncharacterized conserved protein n=1 Tax=Loktanella atrilutea TaxID=366533 RepID=A0A1M5BGY5_LOKAT|nr:hypothetical protein [Loktanella atrilutea]SHF41729.1 Uncharacterized conserved protein [Loktanella atrilutea]
MQIQCHCGQVTLTLPSLPRDLNQCSCSICRRYGALWAYFPPAQVRISGATQAYIWGERTIALHRCDICGVLTHWASRDTDRAKMGVNMQNADPALLAAIPRHDSHARGD